MLKKGWLREKPVNCLPRRRASAENIAQYQRLGLLFDPRRVILGGENRVKSGAGARETARNPPRSALPGWG
ncbi:MAG TPA: hypothetical protein PKO40_10835, partial [Dokdonella sp.]|uniref:hypothetical protein n=1 Tax=Dokdonella sp. TaxID=2291710 RepID=UPI002CE4D0D2